MTWVMIALAVLLVLDIGRMRGRLGSLARIAGEPAAGPADGHVVILAPGVALDAAARRAVIGHAAGGGYDLVDVVPERLPAIRAMSLAQIVDPARLRGDRLADGRSALHAIVVTADVAARARLGAGPTITPRDEVEMIELAARVRHYANRADIAVLAGARPGPAPLSHQKAVLRALFGPLVVPVLLVQPLVWTAMAIACAYGSIAGFVALGVWHLQPLLSIVGTAIRAPDVLAVTVLRAPIEVVAFVATLAGTWRPPRPPDPVDARRATYAELATRRDTFFEPRRETCPVCGSRDLAVHFRVTDLLQHKPGTFTLERCRGCDHIFQNPRLSIAGLDYYYKDFYDGLGERGMEMIFGFSSRAYHARAKLVRGHTTADPARWLDVGAGHGHFCAAATADLPGTVFDGLDLSESIDEAHRRGWITGKYRGLFPELAPTIAGRYDAVSMSHYLEHTLDPRAEIAAAHTALAPGGHLMIEVPDPEYRLGRALGRLWLPWFQPQHLHLLSVGNLERLLREAGFEPLEWHRGEAHQRVDLFFAVLLALDRIAPPRVPWRPASALGGVGRAVVWTLGLPLLGLSTALDFALGPLIRRGRRSNTYRVVARRV